MKLYKSFLCGLILFFSALSYADSSNTSQGSNNGNSKNNEKADHTCDGNWINPITDVCWQCLFPMSIGDTQVSQGSSSLPDTENPSNAIQQCPFPPPIFRRVGIAVGYWEPIAVTDVTRNPMCMVNLGGQKIGGLKRSKVGKATKTAIENTGVFYHTHWYQYPLISWLKLFSDDLCMQGGDFDIGYLSELDPMWNNDLLSIFVNPEAIIFGNPIAQAACIVDALAAEAYLPLNPLFWCAGGHGSVYPFTGAIRTEASGMNSSVLLSERMNFKLHRQGIITDTVPYNTAVCFSGQNPIVPKDRYRYHLVNPTADANNCYPYGRGVMRWQAGKEMPNSHKNYGHLIWRKRNCVVF